jgi:beta-lactamase regulating signal transducer with metallopeptidase domain
MTTLSLDPALSAALEILLKASVLVAIAAVVQIAMRRWSSAAIRHSIWMLAIAGLLALPLLSSVLPEWQVVTRIVSPPAAGSERPAGAVDAMTAVPGRSLEGSSDLAPAAHIPDDSTSPSVQSSAFPRPSVLAGVYAIGVVIILAYVIVQRRRLHDLAEKATDPADVEWTLLMQECAARIGVTRQVRLRRTREGSMPMTFGVRRPVILIPAIADTWSVDRRRAVVLHELAHVARRDCLAQTLALAACALYWIHPAAWWVTRRLRVERELACDDRVIAAGAPPREYAGHLLEIAFSLGAGRAPALAVTMARPRQLEGRMRALLDATRNRRAPAVRSHVTGTIVAAAIVFPLASATSKVVGHPPHEGGTIFDGVSASQSQPDVIAPMLKAVGWPFVESARRFITAVASAAGVSQDRLPGSWEIRPGTADATVHLQLTQAFSSSGSNVRLEQLEGLSAGQLSGAGGPVQFRLRRDAGTFNFEGVIRNGVGGGVYSFAPDPNFPAELAKRGFARPTAVEQYRLARNDTGYAFVDELNTQRYARPDTAGLVRAGDHGVSLTYLREMGALGYRLGTLDPLIQLRDHGVTPGYIRELATQGYKGLAADELQRARDHGITPDYVQALRENGHSGLTMAQLITARDHGVDADYVRAMRQLGYTVAIEELVAARDHGVDAGYTREIAALGYAGQPLERLRAMRDHGVDPQYVQQLKALGYDQLSVDELITLRDHGVTAERIKAANARAGKRLPVDLLKQLAR